MRAESINLVTQYKDGKEIKQNKVKIFAKKKSLKRTEFYAAYGVGLRLNYIFSIIPSEFKLADIEHEGVLYTPTHVEYKGKLYEIVRTYEVDSYNMEITVK